MVADDPAQKIKLKTFHSEIINDHDSLAREAKNFLPFEKQSPISSETININYLKIKGQVANLIEEEIEKLLILQESKI